MSSVLRICDFLVCFLETLSSFARLLSINTNTHSCNHYDGRPQRTHTNTHTQTYSVCLLVLAADCRCVNQCCTQTNILTSLSFSFSASQTHTEADRVCLSVTHTHTHTPAKTCTHMRAHKATARTHPVHFCYTPLFLEVNKVC